jgi:hypothetical protein
MLYKVGLDMNLSMYLGRSNPNPFGIGFGHTQEIS